jgi:hypothetical protein
MNNFFINMEHVANPEKTFHKSKEPGSKSLFLTFCMHATGVRRLFDKETTREFIWRLAVMFRHYNIVPKFFTDDTLVQYDDRGVQDELCLNDIIEHIGLELWDGPTDLVPREDWRGKIETYWISACKIAVFTGIPILDQRVIGKNQFVIGSNKPKPITVEFENTADLLADAAIKTIGDQIFIELSQRLKDKKIYLEQYRAHLATKPRYVFNYMKIPMKLKKKIYREMYPNFPIKKYDIMDEINDPDSTFASLIHLAWLWENGYVEIHEITMGEKHSYTAEVDERVDFDYERYDGLNRLEFGVNIYYTYYEYGLDKIAHYLKEKE